MPQYIQDAGFFLENPKGPTIIAYSEDGERLVQKVPGTVQNKNGIRRWRKVCTSTGHVVCATLTNHAADLDINGSYGRRQRELWREFGHFEIGKCPISLVFGEDLAKEQLCKDNQKAVDKAETCQAGTCSEKSPCKHAIKERDVRRERHTKQTLARRERWTEKEQRMIRAQENSAARMADAVEKMTEAMKASK